MFDELKKVKYFKEKKVQKSFRELKYIKRNKGIEQSQRFKVL